MHYYKIKIMKTSGYLNESAGKAPKVLYVESKEALSERQALIRVSKKYKDMYGAEIRVADVEQVSEGLGDWWQGKKAGWAASKQAKNYNKDAKKFNKVVDTLGKNPNLTVNRSKDKWTDR